jgi:hypothetical protein
LSRLATAFVLGYHGCERAVGEQALGGDLTLIQSDREHDWLGPGVYFWESDPMRAREWAEEKATRGRCKEPFVIGAVIDLGNCLDLTVRENIELLGLAYQDLAERAGTGGLPLPENKNARGDPSGDRLLRYLDCAVIKTLHSIIEQRRQDGDTDAEPFDTVRGLFTEGEPAYAGSAFKRKTHTQIAVCADRCIKGVFVPR